MKNNYYTKLNTFPPSLSDPMGEEIDNSMSHDLSIPETVGFAMKHKFLDSFVLVFDVVIFSEKNNKNSQTRQ